MVGPPGAGKSMLAQRLPSILPPMDAREMLEASMIASLAGELGGGQACRGASAPSARRIIRRAMPALVGGGLKRQARRNGARPSWRPVSRRIAGIPAARARIACASRLRSGEIAGGARQLSRHLSGPLPDGRRDESVQMRHGGRARPCSAPRARAAPATIRRAFPGRCSTAWTSRSNLPAVRASDLTLAAAPRKAVPRSPRGSPRRGMRQRARFAKPGPCRIFAPMRRPTADCSRRSRGPTRPDCAYCARRADAMALSARGYHRVLRVARTLADLDGEAGSAASISPRP